MPNWCEVKITIDVEEATPQGKELIEAAFLLMQEVNTKRPFFQTLYPMPTELLIPVEMPRISDYHGVASMVEGESLEDFTARADQYAAAKELAESKLKALTEKYGAKDWYDWRVKNWGTKWDLADGEMIREEENVYVLTGNTAWSPPVELLLYLYQVHNVVSSCYFFEPGMAYAGVAFNGADYKEYQDIFDKDPATFDTTVHEYLVEDTLYEEIKSEMIEDGDSNIKDEG